MYLLISEYAYINILEEVQQRNPIKYYRVLKYFLAVEKLEVQEAQANI